MAQDYESALKRLSATEIVNLRRTLETLGYQSHATGVDDSLIDALRQFADDAGTEAELDSSTLLQRVDEAFGKLPRGAVGLSREAIGRLDAVKQQLASCLEQVNETLRAAPGFRGNVRAIALNVVQDEASGKISLSFDLGTGLRPNIECFCSPPGVCVPCDIGVTCDVLCW